MSHRQLWALFLLTVYSFSIFNCKEYKERQESLLSEQCIEIVGNNRIGKTRDLFKKIGDTKGAFYANKGQKWQGSN